MAKDQMPIPPGARREVSEDTEQPELNAAIEAPPIAVPIAPKVASKRRIKVTATRAGFIYNERKVQGDKFEVVESQLGTWMECEDPVEQKNHLKRMDMRRREANRRSVEEHERDRAAVE